MKKALLMITIALFPRMMAAQDANIDAFLGEHWYGLYFNGQKAGFMRNALEKRDDGGIIMTEDAQFRVLMGGFRQEMHTRAHHIYGPDGELEAINSYVKDSAGVKEFNARVEGAELVLTITMGNESTTERLPRPDESLRDAVAQIRLVTDGPALSDSVTFTTFDPMLKTAVTATSTVVAKERRIINGVDTAVYKFETVLEQMGIRSVGYITESGVTLEDTVAGVITMRLEPEPIAKDVNYENDVIVSNAARIEDPIPDARTRDLLRLEVRGPLTDDLLFTDERQTMTRKDGHVLFEGRQQRVSDVDIAQIPVTDAAVQRWMQPSTFVQSDHPRLVAKARELVGDETDAYEIVKILCRWVYRNVETVYSAQLSNAIEVLDDPRGDCTEHSILFVGLARAAGLPAREVAGLIYVEQEAPGFYFHQWASVWVGKWIDVDPTFDQVLADVTHVKLAQDDLLEQVRLVPVIGKLEIAVVD